MADLDALMEPVFRSKMRRVGPASLPHKPVYEEGCRQDPDKGHIIFDACIAPGSELLQKRSGRPWIEDAVLFNPRWRQGVFHIAVFVIEKAPAVRCPIGLFMPRPN